MDVQFQGARMLALCVVRRMAATGFVIVIGMLGMAKTLILYRGASAIFDGLALIFNIERRGL
jgi:hypothetical protein